MSLYGYPQKTNPKLTQLQSDSANGRLFTFNDVISPEATTVPALRKVLTNINNTNNIEFENCITVVDLFKKAGYQTFWISNQVPLGKYDSPNAVIAASADHEYFTSYKNSIKNTNAATGNYFDSDLLPVFQSYFNNDQTYKNMTFFVHLQGSHFYYNDRYPANFNIFKPKKNGDVNSYLNTVVFNDYVVDKLIEQAMKDHFDMVCYFSDHGEDMTYQHNQEHYTRNMSTIPFMVYLSKNYIKEHPELVASLDKNKYTPAMTDNFFQVIQTLASIKSSKYDPSESFLTNGYIQRKRRVLNNSIPYDK